MNTSRKKDVNRVADVPKVELAKDGSRPHGSTSVEKNTHSKNEQRELRFDKFERVPWDDGVGPNPGPMRPGIGSIFEMAARGEGKPVNSGVPPVEASEEEMQDFIRAMMSA